MERNFFSERLAQPRSRNFTRHARELAHAEISGAPNKRTSGLLWGSTGEHNL